MATIDEVLAGIANRPPPKRVEEGVYAAVVSSAEAKTTKTGKKLVEVHFSLLADPDDLDSAQAKPDLRTTMWMPDEEFDISNAEAVKKAEQRLDWTARRVRSLFGREKFPVWPSKGEDGTYTFAGEPVPEDGYGTAKAKGVKAAVNQALACFEDPSLLADQTLFVRLKRNEKGYLDVNAMWDVLPEDLELDVLDA